VGEKSIKAAAVEFAAGMLPAPDVTSKAVSNLANAVSETVTGAVSGTLEKGIAAGVKEEIKE
jgi:hypothetical protein